VNRTTKPRRSLRSFWGNLLLVVASLVVTIVLFDLVLLLVLGPVRVIEDFYQPDPRFGYRMRSNLEFRFASPYHGYDATVRTNSLGLRDGEVASPKPAGTLRILLLGDSMTAGLEVDKDQTFEAVAEKALARQRPVEVINAGVRGYNLDNIIGWLHSEGLGLEPDLVIYFFTDNDITSEAAWSPAGSDISRGFKISGLVGRLATYSHVLDRVTVLRQRWEVRRQRDDPRRATGPTYLPGGLVSCFSYHDFDAQAGFRLTAQRIERLHDLCAAQGIPFWLATTPQREEIEPEAQARLASLVPARLDFDGVTRFLDWVAQRLDTPRFDATAAFRTALPQDGTYWYHRDGHLNPRGHRLLGEQLARAIGTWPGFAARR
jgi:lysophospholipase L1-like esterase